MTKPSAAAWPALAGILCANALPHLATWARGRRLMTPIAGPGSGPRLNGAWGAANLAGGLALLAANSGRDGDVRQPDGPDRSLPWFLAAAAAFSAWAAVAERLGLFHAPRER